MRQFFDFIERRFEETICVLGLAVMASCVMTQVLLRVLFSAAAAWAEEVAVYGMVTAIYLGCSLAIRERAHIRLTLAVERLPAKIRLAVVIAGDVLWFAFIVLLLIQSIGWIQVLFDKTFISPALEIHQKWPQSVVPFSLCLMLVRLVQVYYRWLRDGDRELPL